MKQKITINSCTELSNNRFYIIGTNEKKEIECFYGDKNTIPDYYLMRKGDNLIIEYDKKEEEGRTITSIEKWRISNMKERLIYLDKNILQLIAEFLILVFLLFSKPMGQNSVK